MGRKNKHNRNGGGFNKFNRNRSNSQFQHSQKSFGFKTYNRHQSQSPGRYQSSAVSPERRRQLEQEREKR